MILFAALLCASLLFVACGEPQEGNADSTPATNGGKPTDMVIADATEQDTKKHEIHNYFDLVSEQKDVLLSTVTRIDGEVISYDREYNLAVICKKDLDLYNRVTETWNVYDLNSGKIIHTESVTNAYMAEASEKTELTVTIEYPVIRVERKYGIDTEETPATYEVSYFMAKDGSGEAIHTTTEKEFAMHNYQNGLVCVEMGDKMFWIDKNLEIIRSVETIFAGGYDVEVFSSEYKGYLYSWEKQNGEIFNDELNNELLIFNHEGMVSARYLADKDSFIKVFVLNNGNALVQEYKRVTIYDKYDFVLNGTRYTVKSSIVDHVTGATETVEPGFIVSSLVTKYYQGKNDVEQLVLTGADNYAYLYNYANGYVAKHASLSVLDNSLKKLFTLENETYGVDFSTGVFAIRDDMYGTTVKTEDNYYSALFDLDGNLISYINGVRYATDKYIITDTAIYDYNMKSVFNVQDSGMSYAHFEDNVIYLSYNNYETGAVEYYAIRSDSKTPELFADGVKFTVNESVIGEGYYTLYDVERDVYVIYNSNGDALITSYENIRSSVDMSDVRLFSTTFNGEKIVYVVK